MKETMRKIAAVLLIGFTLVGCAASGVNPGTSAPDQSNSKKERNVTGY